jgi:hypothetical protein
MQKKYEILAAQPLARFYYQGNHSHPVRRTVLLSRETDTYFVGYELRVGRIVRSLSDAPIKTYRKADIARYSDYSRLRMSRRTRRKRATDTTLVRGEIMEMTKLGV